MLIPQNGIPRFSQSLEVHANVGERLRPNIGNSPDFLRKKIDSDKRRKLLNSPYWVLMKNVLQSHTEIQCLLKNLKRFIQDALGNDTTPGAVDEAVVSLMETYNKDPLSFMDKYSSLKEVYCFLSRATLEKIYKLLSEISMMMERDKFTVSNDYIGSGFRKTPPCVYITSMKDIDTSILFSGYEIKRPSFQDNVKDFKKSSQSKNKIKYTATWLQDELNKSLDGETALSRDIVESIIDLLCSKKSNDELQTDLFDLLGFERFELIETILLKRSDIQRERIRITTFADTYTEPKRDSRQIPQISVTVESENERLIKKQIRKDEKKIARLSSKVDKNKSTDALNQLYLKQQREEALVAERQTPIFSRQTSNRTIGPGISPAPDFPFVFDSFSKAKTAPGFITGVKLHLPTGFERLKEKEFEEIRIPAESKDDIPIPKTLIPIESLDELGQIVFKGCKNLNLIQSVVFNTAYYSNENILVCAPTGAGKTNVALLTVIHQIKLHMKNGVISKDDFKIVYVAPMKALAAEMTNTFGKKLAPLGLQVKELTGDMKLTKFEIMSTQMIVTTPEKWDVTTRKPGDDGLTNKIKLLIIDEVHLLHGERGAVIEALVARTLRQVESSQSMIRIVGLSATLPNYVDVANFLRVNPYTGLFFFDGRFRPVPLEQTFVGVTGTGKMQQMQQMDQICMQKVTHYVSRGHQVMVFVHARTATVRTAMTLRELAKNQGSIDLFRCSTSPDFNKAEKSVQRSRNKQLKELFADGFCIHHAGMLRSDRSMVEKLFTDGFINVLVCTATLAWGVNLPAHAVIIKGTEIYDAKHGSFVDLGILDVVQIFGRAGRPQFDKLGSGCIITTHDKLSHYLSLLTCQYPIESSFVQRITDNLNAEICLGTVTNVEEGKEWLSYTYLYVRMRKNPQVYGIKYTELHDDPALDKYREDLIKCASLALDRSQMIRYDEVTGYLHATDLGRTASSFYIRYETIEIFNELLTDALNEEKILSVLCKAQEFDQLKVRDDELDELDNIHRTQCPLLAEGGSENTYGKVNILLQSYISRAHIESFSLISDQGFVAQNASRIMRALFEITLKKGWAIMAGRLLKLSLVLEKTLWHYENPLRQFTCLSHEIMDKIERKKLSVEILREMTSDEIGHMINHVRMGKEVKKCAESLPRLDVEATVQPITSSVLRVKLNMIPDFIWNDSFHGKTNEAFWIWVEDPLTNNIYHYEYFLIAKKQVVKAEEQVLVFTIPIFEPLPSQYCIRICSDRWLGSENVVPLSFKHLILPDKYPPHTELLDLQPLPITALQNPLLESLYTFTHFNPIQTQLFHCLYHTDNNVLVGAPTGSGKTITAEIAMFKVFRDYPGKKVVYIAPLKALVREQLNNWKSRLEKHVGLNVVELTGDFTPDVSSINASDIIVTTPEKWDGVSRNWQTRNYVRDVALIVIDEIHLLGEDRGPVLEVIVSRLNFIAANTNTTLRVIGLSTALANAQDLANWLGIREIGMYNFRPSVRPVPLEVHIHGFPGKHYCPRMATMNKPAYQAINTYSPSKPVLIFVSSRRQTRLTSMDLIAYLAGGCNPKQWLHLDELSMDTVLSGIRDSDLRLSLSFGIGLHHAGLHEQDRRVVEELFVNQQIQVLIATSTLAWGVNFPAHLVIVKGTEYYDGKTKRYVDFPVTDVLQMMGRAGRPQFDDHGIAVIYVQDTKKQFYKKFLYEPFPVESSLLDVLPDHINAEIVAETIKSKDDALEYLTWTYFFRRLLQNPSYYGLEDTQIESINKRLSEIAQDAINKLSVSSCLEILEDARTLRSTNLGVIASYYYISHITAQHFRDSITPDIDLEELLHILCEVHEYSELPVRHNEDNMNSNLSVICPLPVDQTAFDSPHVKANLLLQAHFFRLPLPCADYYTDLKSVLDQAIRLLQAMIDVSAAQGWLSTTLKTITILQMCIQACWWKNPTISCLPHLNEQLISYLRKASSGFSVEGCHHLPVMMALCQNGSFEKIANILRQELFEYQIQDIFVSLQKLPTIKISLTIHEENLLENEITSIEIPLTKDRTDNANWIPVIKSTNYSIIINLKRLNRVSRQERRCFAPKFPKQKDEGWIFILGNPETKELVALKRAPFIWGHSTQMLQFVTPEIKGKVIYNLYILSDSYLGLDQQYHICLDIY